MSDSQAPVVSSQQVGQMYDELLPFFEALLGSRSALHFGYWDDDDTMSWPDAADRLTDLVADQIAVTQGQHVLDVGCGHGQPSARLARTRLVQVTGITVSAAQVAAAADHVKTSGLADRVHFQQTDAMRLTFADNTFDAAMALESISHMSDPLTAVRGLHRVLRPGGRLVIADFFRRRPLTAEEHAAWTAFMPVLTQDSPVTRSLHSLRELLTEGGLRVLEVSDISKQTAKSVDYILQALRENADIIAEKVGDEHARKAEQAMARFTDYIGYFLAVAEKPAD